VFLGAAEPRKLRVQRRDGLGRSLGPGREDNSGVWLRLGVRLPARTPVAGLSFAAARADAPQLLGRLIKEEVGEGGHGCSLGMTIHPVEGTEKQEKWDALCRLYSSCFQRYAGPAESNVRPSAAWRLGCRNGLARFAGASGFVSVLGRKCGAKIESTSIAGTQHRTLPDGPKIPGRFIS
jgi:hypothetical protein